jgi:nitroreductase
MPLARRNLVTAISREEGSMFEHITPHHGAILDEIVRSRHSVRAFAPAAPSRADVEAIIRAGLLAPFAALAVTGQTGFRKVFVLRSASAAMESAAAILKERVAARAADLEREVGVVPFVQRLKRAGHEGVPGVGSAPYFVVLAEKKGMPPIAAESLCYCLENMWLKATSLRIGMQLVSATTQMGSDPAFCELLDIAVGEYALDGCALGYPADGYRPPQVDYPTLGDSVRWL